MKNTILFLAILTLLLLPAAATDINVTVAAKGDTFIEWQWDSGYDLTHILIDGTEICGYETTDNTIIRTGFEPNSPHTINVTDDVNYGNNLIYTSGNITSMKINQSLAQDPTSGRANPWDLWVLAGLLGIALLILSLIKPRLYRMDYEINIILSVAAWPFLWYFTWGALTSIDRVVGVGMTSTGSTAIMVTQHILYSFPVIGWIGVAADVAAIFVTVILVAQFNLFKDNEEKEKQNQNQNQ